MSKSRRKRSHQINLPRPAAPARTGSTTALASHGPRVVLVVVAAGIIAGGAWYFGFGGGDEVGENRPVAEAELIPTTTSDTDLAPRTDFENAAPRATPVSAADSGDDSGMVQAPGLGRPSFVAPLADAYRRLDPANDGWLSEAFNEAAGEQLKKLSQLMTHASPIDEAEFTSLAAEDFVYRSLRPETLAEEFSDGVFRVEREQHVDRNADQAPQNTPRGAAGLAAAVNRFAELYGAGRIERVKLKLFKVDVEQAPVTTQVYFQSLGPADQGLLQVNAVWTMRWTSLADEAPRLLGVDVADYETVLHPGGGDPLFADCTESVLGAAACYGEQFLYPTDHWRGRLPRDLGLDVVANHGLAVGDVNGDHLDDLYVCQQGGLPNRLLIQNTDGTLRDAAAESGADWLDYCAGALLVDLDNDGDRDLIVAQEWKILLMSNDGHGRFQLEFGIGSKAQTFSLSAADYDLDGDLDVYCCGYNPTASTLRRGAMGEPMPYHDANNGGQNTLLRNEGNWRFDDVTEQVGLDENNTRFSFAASWEDYDNDGDADLYVANDYGRNNLYRNEAGRFRDVAGELGVEDTSAGMSANWADYNRDGWMDLYVSNMFSAAGNRITYQRQFKTSLDPAVREQFQRHARGNTLFEGTGDGGFKDVSEAAGVTMGRWAWGSRFVDLNSDGWDDLVAANGFISTEDSGDL